MNKTFEKFIENLNWKKMGIMGAFILIPFSVLIVALLLVMGVITADDIAKIVGSAK